MNKNLPFLEAPLHPTCSISGNLNLDFNAILFKYKGWFKPEQCWANK